MDAKALWRPRGTMRRSSRRVAEPSLDGPLHRSPGRRRSRRSSCPAPGSCKSRSFPLGGRVSGHRMPRSCPIGPASATISRPSGPRCNQRTRTSWSIVRCATIASASWTYGRTPPSTSGAPRSPHQDPSARAGRRGAGPRASRPATRPPAARANAVAWSASPRASATRARAASAWAPHGHDRTALPRDPTPRRPTALRASSAPRRPSPHRGRADSTARRASASQSVWRSGRIRRPAAQRAPGTHASP